jgi:hypothetical protein
MLVAVVGVTSQYHFPELTAMVPTEVALPVVDVVTSRLPLLSVFPETNRGFNVQ